jgi:peptide/nickel transport system substrate-binding protein
MRRRTIGLILILSLLTAPPAANAQQRGKVPRIGVLLPGSPTPEYERRLDAFRQGLRELGYIDVVLEAPGHGLVNPLLDIQKALPASVDSENYGNYSDPLEVELYEKMLRETDPARQRALMRRFEQLVLDDQAHMIWVLWWHRIVPYRSYVKGFKIAPTHFINQDLATIWLDK